MQTLRAPVPVLPAASGPLTLRVAAELADGAMVLLTGPKALGEPTISPTLARHAAAAGRPRPPSSAWSPQISPCARLCRTADGPLRPDAGLPSPAGPRKEHRPSSSGGDRRTNDGGAVTRYAEPVPTS